MAEHLRGLACRPLRIHSRRRSSAAACRAIIAVAGRGNPVGLWDAISRSTRKRTVRNPASHGTSMSISTYDATIKPHLTAAQEYAYRTTREISRLPARPAFFTLAQDELAKARQS